MTEEAILKQIEATYGIGVGSNRAALRKERLAIIKLAREEGYKEGVKDSINDAIRELRNQPPQFYKTR